MGLGKGVRDRERERAIAVLSEPIMTGEGRNMTSRESLMLACVF